MESQLDTEQDRRWKKKSGILKGTSNGLRQQSVARRAVIKEEKFRRNQKFAYVRWNVIREETGILFLWQMILSL